MAAGRGVRAGLAVAALVAGAIGTGVGVRAWAAPACTASQAGPTAASALARACHGRVEVLSARTSNAQTFADPDGTMTLEESVVPRWAHRADGTWTAVDTTLHKAAAGTVVPAAAVEQMSFSGGGTGPLATLTEDGRQLSMTWPGVLPVPTLQGDTAVYAGVLPDVDLKVTASAKGFAEVLVVKTAAAAANPAVRQVTFGLATKGVTAAATDGGGLSAKDAKGRVIFAAPAPLVWDSSDRAAAAAGGSPATAARRQAAMPVRLSAGKLTVTPDPALLTDPGVRYPLYVDPSWSGGIWNGTDFTSLSSKYPKTSFWDNGSPLNDSANKGGMGAGLVCDTDNNGNCTSPTYTVRSLFKMNTTGVLGKAVYRATFQIEQRWSWTCNPKSNGLLVLLDDITPSMTWERQPYWHPTLRAQGDANHRAGGGVGCANTGTVEFDATAMVVNSVVNGSWVTPVGLRANDERTVNQWKRYNYASALMTIVYNSPPNAPDTLTVDGKPCGTGTNRAYVTTASPTLRARLSDPDPDTLTGSFTTAKLDPSSNQFVDVPGGAGSQGAIPNGGFAQYTPTGEVDGGVYNVRVRADDDKQLSGPTVGGCEWQVDLADPVQPTVTADIYPAGSAGCPPAGCGSVGQTGTFTFASSADVVGYLWGFGDPPSTAVNAPSPGAPVTVKWTPTSGGAKTLYVKAVDRAGRTATTSIQFVVAGPAPAVARWLLDEPAGATALTDDTGNGHTATLTGGTPGVPGRIAGGDTALRFAGTGNASAAHVVDTSRSFSVAAWVRLGAGGTTRTVASQEGVHGASFRLKFTVPCNCWVFETTDADSASEVDYYARSADNTAALNVWTHLIGSYDAAQGKVFLYVNGVLAASVGAPPTPWNGTGAFVIGRSRWHDSPGDFMVGDLAQVQVWNRVLLDTEIVAMTDPFNVSDVGEWHMDEVGPGPAADSSGLQHDLTFVGGAQIPPSGSGHSGTGLHLNGTGAYAQTSGPVLNTDQSFTVSAWARLAATGGSGTQVVLSQDGTRTSAFQLGYRPSDSRWTFGVASSDVDSPAVATAVSDAPAVAGQWTQLTGVYDAATRQLRLYLNGVAQFTTATATGTFNSAGSFALGRAKGAGSPIGFFGGDIDEARAFAAAVPDRSGPNLAPGATVSTSSNAPTAWGWDPTSINNGPPSARMPGWSSWATDQSPHTEWVQLTMPGQRQISRVDLYSRLDAPNTGSGFPANFTIEQWNGSAWVVLVGRTGYPTPATGEVQTFTFAPVTTDRIRIVGTSLGIMQFAEVEFYGAVNRIP